AVHPVGVAFQATTDLLAGEGVPQSCRLVVGCGDDLLAVRAEGSAPQRSLMALQDSLLGNLIAVLDVPYPSGAVERRGHDPPPIKAELGLQYSMRMPFQDGELMTDLCIPKSGRIVFGSGNDPAAVGAESGTEEPLLMSFHRDRLIPDLSVPYPNGVVVRRCHDAPAIVSEGGKPNMIEMPA